MNLFRKNRKIYQEIIIDGNASVTQQFMNSSITILSIAAQNILQTITQPKNPPLRNDKMSHDINSLEERVHWTTYLYQLYHNIGPETSIQKVKNNYHMHPKIQFTILTASI